jgi:hypothetical protein
MALPGLNRRIQMSDSVRGAFGSFTTVGTKQLSYIMTRLDREQLRRVQTVRSVVPRKLLRIRELMQRDIDDDRVRSEIIQYLTPRDHISEARFFPPIVVALLPLARDPDGTIPSLYSKPELANGKFPRRLDQSDQTYYEEREFGEMFALRIPLERPEADVLTASFFYGAELHWNRDHTSLVAIDGQHRLVALKAILGLLEPEDQARGYESSEFDPVTIAKLGFHSLPVCIVFPTELYDGNPDLSSSDGLIPLFRQVFVDVNRNAKTVSETRNILLNEQDLLSVFTRRVVDSFLIESELPPAACGTDQIPLYCFEWDSLDNRAFQITDARAISSVGILRRVVEGAMMGESGDADAFRTSLGIEELDPELEPDVVGVAGVPLASISFNNISDWQQKVVEKRFDANWIPAISHILRNLHPFSHVIEALEAVRVDWTRKREVNREDWVVRDAITFLLGSRGDQEQLRFIADTYEGPVGRFDPGICEQAIKKVEDEAFRVSVDLIRKESIGRLLLSHLGQVELFEFLFRTLWRNLPAGTVTTRLELAKAFVEEFNLVFPVGSDSSRFFSQDEDWNELCIGKLGTQAFRRTHVAGLFRISLCFFEADGPLAALWGGGDTWFDVQADMISGGANRLRESLLSRLPYQFHRAPEAREIVDEIERRKYVQDRVATHLKKTLKNLRDFLTQHGCDEELVKRRIK